MKVMRYSKNILLLIVSIILLAIGNQVFNHFSAWLGISLGFIGCCVLIWSILRIFKLIKNPKKRK